MATLFVAILAAIVGSLVTWYLQRRWTPDAAAEVLELRKEVAGIRKEFVEFKENAETREKSRAEFEHFPVNFSLTQGAPGNYIGLLKNDSKYKVYVETIQILRGDTDHESPLTEAVKLRPTDDWTVEPGSNKTLYWGPQHDPVSMLRSLVRSSDPNFPNGSVIPIALVLTFKVQGNLHTKKHTQQILVQGNQILPWGPCAGCPQASFLRTHARLTGTSPPGAATDFIWLSVTLRRMFRFW